MRHPCFHKPLCERAAPQPRFLPRPGPILTPMRRILTAIILTAIVGGTAWWLWHWQQGPEKPADPWATVAPDAVAVLEVPEPFKAWERFTGTSQFWGELEALPAYAALDTVIKRLGRPRADARPGDARPLLITWRINADNRAVPVVAMAWPRSEDALERLGTALGTRLSPQLWTGARLTARPDTALPALELAWSHGILVAGTDGGHVDEARALIGAAAKPDPLFAKAKASLSMGADAHLLARGSMATRLLALPDRGLLPTGAALSGWLAMDIRFRPGAVLMNGLLFPEGGSAPLSAIRGQGAAKLEVARVLPATATDLIVVQVDDPAAYVRALHGSLPDDQLFGAYGAWVRGGVGVARGAGPEVERWAVLGTSDPAAASTAIRMRCPDGGCPTTDYRGIQITRLADPGALADLYGKDFAGLGQPLWAVLGDQVVFADTPAGMRAAIDAWVDRNSLALDPRTGDFFDRFASEAVVTVWADVPRSYPDGTGPLGEAQRTMGSALLQLAPRQDGALIATFCLQHEPGSEQTGGALWTAALPAPLAAPPMLVKDYLSKTLQVFTQDRDDRISLISCTGKILWQRQLDGPLLGEVRQIDRYKNGKLQLLFNTRGRVYLIDRLGRDVEGFPVDIKAGAGAPLNVFDYEGNKDYRILVPLANGRILNLGPVGRPVQGWEPEVLASPAAVPVDHVRIKGRDYLVVVQRNGQVAVLDRRGTARYTPKLRMRGMQTFLDSRDAMDIADRRLIWADSSGAVLSGTLGGEVDTLSPATSGKVALFSPGPEQTDAILRTTASAVQGEYKGKVLFRASFPDAPQAVAFAVPMGAEGDDVGLVQPEQQQVRLYDPAGNIRPGFPLKGAVPFRVADINLDGVPELVTADQDGVVTVYALPARR